MIGGNGFVGKRAITADTALRLVRYFGTSAELWLNLQAHYELELARDALEEKVIAEVRPVYNIGDEGAN